MMQHLDTQTAQLIAHLRRGGNYCYLWAATQQMDTDNQPLWKCTYWDNGTGPSELPADQHARHGPVNLCLGANPIHQIPQERKRLGGTIYQPNPGNVRPLVEEICALNCLYAEYDVGDFGDKRSAIQERIATLPSLASVIIDSGDGYPCFWLLDAPFLFETPVARSGARDLQARWVALIGGDDDAKDLSRMLRLPSTQNYKHQLSRLITSERAESNSEAR